MMKSYITDIWIYF